MKIVCDACQAKYSISDDKVQGKVFKIRCKKCSNIIVVRGGAGASEPAPARAYVEAIERMAGVSFCLVSVGPDRSETIRLRDPFA